MPKLIRDETYWRDRAEEARSIEGGLKDAECKKIMREIAESYERLAELTTRFRAAAKTKDKASS